MSCLDSHLPAQLKLTNDSNIYQRTCIVPDSFLAGSNDHPKSCKQRLSVEQLPAIDTVEDTTCC